MITAAVTAGGPAIAAAFDAANADKVDGRHAVGPGATAPQRAGKLVATNSKGRLPNSIIDKAPDAQLLDGKDSAAFSLSGHLHDDRYLTADAHTKELHDTLGIDAATVGGKTAADLAYGAGSGLSLAGNVFSVTDVPWSELTGVPPEILDGDDNVDGGNAADLSCTSSSGCVSSGEIAGTIAAAKVGSGLTGMDHIQDATISSADLAGSYEFGHETQPGAVTSAKIADGAIEGRDIADGAIEGRDLDIVNDASRLIDPGPILAMTRFPLAVAVSGVQAGDLVIVSPPAGLEDDLLFVGSAVRDGYVDLYLYNNSDAPLDGGPLMWKMQHLDLTP